MKLKAYAKINLSLRVFDKRADGFHPIESIMQSVSLFDIITLTPIESGIEVFCDNKDVPTGAGNIAYKAAELFYKNTEHRTQNTEHRGIRIQIEKHIPIAAGLAGGSADAAAVIYGLSRLSTIDFPLSTIEIGSDVPFCLTGGTCLVKGRGEIVEKLDDWQKTCIIIVNPGIHISAKWAYDEFDKYRVNAPAGIKNDLEPAVAEKYPIIGEIKERLVKLGCSEAHMSGSGSSVFGLIKNYSEAQMIVSKIKYQYEFCHLAETVSKGIEVFSDER